MTRILNGNNLTYSLSKNQMVWKEYTGNLVDHKLKKITRRWAKKLSGEDAQSEKKTKL